MTNYIPAEKLKAEIERLREQYQPYLSDFENGCREGRNDVLDDLHFFITSLQQEQPSLPSNLNEAAKEYDEAESWSYEALPYTRRAAFIEGAKWMARQMKQEQPEVDLDKEVRTIFNDKKNRPVSFKEFMSIALRFYKLGLNARKEE